MGCGDDEDGGGGPLAPSRISPVDVTAANNAPGRIAGVGDIVGEAGVAEGLNAAGPDVRMAGKPANTINFNGVDWEWNAKRTHLEPQSFPDARALSNSNVWRRDSGTGLIRIFSNDDLSGFGFETAGGRWDLSQRRVGLYVSEITGTEVDQISSGGDSGGRDDGGGDDTKGGGDDGEGNGPRNTDPALECNPSNTNPTNATRLGAIDPGVGTVSFLIQVICNRNYKSDETSTVEGAGSARHFYAGTTGTNVATWVDKTGSASVAGGSNAPTPPSYNLTVNFGVTRNDTGSLRTGRLVWFNGTTKVGERTVQQAAPTTECSLPAVRSFSARAVDPRHNRITWSLPTQPSNCPYTRFELDVVTPTRSSAVQIVSDIDEYIHGALPSCPEERCGALTDDEAVVTYRIRTTNYASHNAGPWSREVTVNRSTDATPTAPLYLQGTHDPDGYVDLDWTKPAFPEDEAGVTYSFQASARGGSWRSWANFTEEGQLTRKISFADMPPVGRATAYKFRVRATLNGRSGPWSEPTNEISTWDAPGRVDIRLSSVHSGNVMSAGKVNLIFGWNEADSHLRESYNDGHQDGHPFERCEISVGNRSSYQLATGITGLDCLTYDSGGGGGRFTGLALSWSSTGLPVDQAIWIRFSLRRGLTIFGPTQEIDITRTDADNDGTADDLVSQNADPPRDSGGGTDCGEYGCNQLPYPPEGVHTYGNGSLTMRWTTTFAGTNSSGNLASIRRMDMKYEACPHRWYAARSRFARIGGRVGAADTNCRTGTGTGRSTGTMTFRGSFGTIGGHQVDMWDTKMDAKVVNSLGKESSWAGWTGGHVVQD